MPDAQELLLHDHLQDLARLKALRDARDADAPVYIIELPKPSPEEDVERRARVAEALRTRPLDEGDHLPWWRERYLPLLRLAVEVGYRYQGTGRVYWPILEAQLELGATGASWRGALSARFQDFRAWSRVGPDGSGWAEHYKHIAWPITHAVLPVELHQPLLRALLATDARRGDRWPETLRRLREHAQARDLTRLTRFFSLPAAEPLTQALVYGEQEVSQLSTALLERVVEDMRQVDGARTLLRQVRLVERRPATAKTLSAAATTKRAGPNKRRCPLLLVPQERGPPHLEVIIPDSGLSAEGTRRAPLRLLEQGRPRGLETLLQPGRVGLEGVTLTASVGTDERLLSDDQLSALGEGEVKAHLKRLLVALSMPLVFGEHLGHKGSARQLFGDDVAPYQTYWLLQKEPLGELPKGVTDGGRVAGLFAARVDSTVADGAGWLQARFKGVVRQAKALRIGAPTFLWPGAWEDGGVAQGELVALKVEREDVLVDGARLAPGLWRLPVQESLSIDKTTLKTRRSAEAPRRAPVARLLTVPEEVTLDALQRGQLALRVEGALPLAGMRVWLRVTGPDGRHLSQAETAPLSALPVTVTADDPVWEQLRAGLEGQSLYGLDLMAAVGALTEERWPLTGGNEERWWRLQPSAPPILEGDAGKQEVTAWAYVTPKRPCATLLVPPETGLVLELALGPGGDALGGVITNVRKALELDELKAGLDARRPTRLLRRLRAPEEDDEGCVGLARLLDARARWANATADGLFAELAKARTLAALESWIVEALCGAEWAREEAQRPATRRRDATELAEALLRVEGLRDEHGEQQLLRRLDPNQLLPGLTRALAEALRPERAWLESLPQGGELTGAEMDGIVKIVERAYALLGVDADDVDPKPDGAALATLLRARREAEEAEARRPALRVLVSTRAWRLARLDPLPLDAPLDTLAERLSNALNLRPEVPTPWTGPQVAALLALWLPPLARADDETLTLALSDRAAVRACRYVALRRRAALGLGST